MAGMRPITQTLPGRGQSNSELPSREILPFQTRLLPNLPVYFRATGISSYMYSNDDYIYEL